MKHPSSQVTRRQFVQTSVAGSLAGALALWTRASAVWGANLRPIPAPASDAARVPLRAVLFDERFAEALRFGEAARERGLPTRSLRADVTDIWYGELHPLWKTRAVPIAGLTAYSALFCLEQLAWDHRMRVIYHGVHPPASNSGPTDWPSRVASMIADVESHGGWTGLAPAPRAPALASSALHSWVIAPPARA